MRKGNVQQMRPEWLSYEQASDLTSLSRSSLQAMVVNGEILASKVGRVVRINRADLERYFYDHAVASGDIASSPSSAPEVAEKQPA